MEDKLKPNVFFSIIIPIYNKASHLKRAIESVISQTYSDYELLLIDDGSTDRSKEIIELYKSIDSRISVYYRTSPGPGGYAARNLGIKKAKGSWIAFIDADDQWDPQFLQSVVDVQISFPMAGCISTGYLNVNSTNTWINPFTSLQGINPQTKLIPFEEFLFYASKDAWPIHTSSVCIQRSLLLDLGGFPSDRCSRGGDRETWLRVVLATPYAWSPVIGATYYRDSDNMVTKTVHHQPTHCMDGLLIQLMETYRTQKNKRLLRLVQTLWNTIHINVIRQARDNRVLTFKLVVQQLYWRVSPIMTFKAFVMVGVQKMWNR